MLLLPSPSDSDYQGNYLCEYIRIIWKQSTDFDKILVTKVATNIMLEGL